MFFSKGLLKKSSKYTAYMVKYARKFTLSELFSTSSKPYVKDSRGDINLINGCLYIKGIKNTLYSDWDSISSGRYSGPVLSQANYAIRNGMLYKVVLANSDTISLLDSSKSWTLVTGWSGYDSNNSAYYWAYGVKNGQLYSIQDNGTITLINSDSTWTRLTGVSYSSSYYSLSSNYYAYGINNGYLYCMQGNTCSRIGSSNRWTYLADVPLLTGVSNSVVRYTYGICDDALYAIYGTTITQIDTNKSWTSMHATSCDYPTGDLLSYAFGIRDGVLYSFLGKTVSKLNDSKKWISVYGSDDPSSDDFYDQRALGLTTEKKLYQIHNGGLIDVGVSNCVEINNNIIICEN